MKTKSTNFDEKFVEVNMNMRYGFILIMSLLLSTVSLIFAQQDLDVLVERYLNGEAISSQEKELVSEYLSQNEPSTQESIIFKVKPPALESGRQTTLLGPEDFSGTFPPTGWVVTDNGNGNAWFDTTNTSYGGGTDRYAGWDDDAWGSGATNRTELTSPAFSTVGYAPIILHFDYGYRDIGTETYSIEVSNDSGATWQVAVADLPQTSATVSAQYPESVGNMVDITAQAGQNPNVMVRFVYDDNGAWGWYGSLDNPMVEGSLLGAHDAGVASIDSPATPYCGGTGLWVTIANFGTDPLTSVDVNWTLNGVGQTTYNWTGSIPAGGTEGPVMISSASFVDGDTIVAWTSLPNGQPDVNSANDSSSTVVRSGLIGTYTIGGVGADYATFNEAANDLNTNGVCGPVVFNVDAASGPYIEQVELMEITGTSATNTITINGNGATLRYGSGDSDNRHVLRLNGADYVTVNDLVIDVDSDSTYGWGIHLTNAADHNTFFNVTVNGDQSSTSSVNFVGIVATGSNTSPSTAGNNANYLTIDGCTVSGGYYGIRLNGSASDALNNTIMNSTIQDARLYHIYLDDTDGTLVSGNDISRPNRTDVSTFYGVYLTSGNVNCTIEKNYIHNTHGSATSLTSASYGIYFSGADATVGQENIAKNNVLYDFNSNGTVYAIYNSSSDGAYYYNNTISLDHTAATGGITRGFYQTTTADNIDFRNNVITITRGGSGTKHALYFATSTSNIISDNNAIWINSAGSGSQYFGNFGGTDYATYNDWRTANGGIYDSLSVNADPVYSNLAGGVLIPTSGAVNNIGVSLPEVTEDILGNPRPANPDPGAYEFSPAAVDVGITQFINLPNSVLPNTVVNFDIEVTNFGQAVPADSLDLFFNGALHSSFGYAALDSMEVDTVSATITASDSGVDVIRAALRMVPGDGNVFNDTLEANLEIEQIFATPFFEDFEGVDPGVAGAVPPGWRNEPDDDLDWDPNSGTTPSSGTGPAFDHTTGTASGVYMYTEATGPSAGDEAHLTTPYLDLTGLSSPMLSFWFHMYGAAMGEIHVDVLSGGVWHNDVMTPLIGQYQTSETDPWLEATASLAAFAGSTIKIRFRGIIGSGFTSDASIDDVFIGDPPSIDMAVTDLLNFPSVAPAGGTVNFDVEVTNVGIDPVSGAMLDIKLNGVLQSSHPVATLDSTESDTIAASVTASMSPGVDVVTAVLQPVPGDPNQANDSLQASYTIIGGDTTYRVSYFIDAGNPDGLNTESDATTTGWTSIMAGSQSANVWSPATPIPFPFQFFGVPVTHFKASQNLVLTFDTAAVALPGENTLLPSDSLPDMSIAALWDSFTGAPPTGSNDQIYTKVFGNAPNRQFWVKWFSFEYGNPNVSFAYISIVLEETTNKIYIVDMYSSSSPILTTTVGLQLNDSTAVGFGDDQIPQAGNGSSNPDNDYWEFFAPFEDIAALNVLDASKLTQMPLTQSTLASAITYSAEYRNFGPGNTGDVRLNVNDDQGASVFSDAINGVTINEVSDTTFTFSPWNASAASPGLYDVAAYATNFNDTIPGNDTTYRSIELGERMAYDNGNHTNNIAYSSTLENWIGTRFTLTDPDTLTSITMMITSSTVATDSFAVDLYTSVNDTPTTAFARIFRGTFGDVGPLPALVTFFIPGGMPMPAGDFYAILYMDTPSTGSFPMGADNTGIGSINIPRRFAFKGGTADWIYFEDAGNTVFQTFIPIVRAGFQEAGEVHDYAVNWADAQANMIEGQNYTVSAEVENRGNQSETDITIEFRENGVFVSDVLLSLNPNEKDTVNFTYTPSDTGVFELSVVSLVPNDFNPGNDTSSVFVRAFDSGREMVFFDDFQDTSFTFANWIVIDDPASQGTWMVYPPPYPNLYTLPVTSRGNVVAADADETGSGTITITTAMLPLDLSGYQEVYLDFDSDWRHLASDDTARISVSNDGGATWTTVLEYGGVSSRNEHISLDLSAHLAGSNDAVIAFESIQPGWRWWWAGDNVAVSGVAGGPPPVAYVQSFEGAFPPPFWSKLNPDGGTGWDTVAVGTSPIPGWTGGTITAPPGGENAVAFCTWNTGGATSNDQYLITPRLVNVQAGDSISFWLRYWPDTYNDTLDVVISTTDPSDPANFNILVDQLGFGAGSDTNWVMYSYDLSGHVSPGSNAYIGFREHVQDNFNNGASFSFDLFSTNAVVDTGQIVPPSKLLLTEIVVTPTAGEFIEIFNPGSDPVDLSDYYVTDATHEPSGTYYYQIVQGGGGGGGSADWHARFPDGASIAPGEYQTIALAGDSLFYVEYGVLPTYELYEDGHANPSDVPDMREAFPGSINNQGTLTNGDEVVILYFWDGMSDLVQDVDYLLYNSGSPAPNDEAVDKTGVCMDGPDPDTLCSTYLADTPVQSQRSAPSAGVGFSVHRVDYLEGLQVQTGGNGVTGADETSENLDSTFTNNSLPSPGGPWHPVNMVPFFDNFESFTAGQRLAAQNPNTWTTWSLNPGDPTEDPMVSDNYAYSGDNSVVIVQNNDLVKPLGTLTSGKWKISFQVYIPNGKAGYFNTLAAFDPPGHVNTNWGMECYFDVGGGGRLFGGSATAVTFSYSYDTWQLVEVIVDLDNDLAEFHFDGSLVHSWQWTLGASGGGSPLQVEASDIFGATPNDEMYFDDYQARSIVTDIDDEVLPNIPTEFALKQNFPNPFNPTTTFRYQLPRNTDVKIVIFNVLGQRVKTLVDARQEPGYYEVQWDALNDHGSKVASGIYIYRMQAGDFIKTRKMILLK